MVEMYTALRGQIARCSTIVPFGDSIIGSNFSAVTSANDTYSARGDVVWANAILGGALEILANVGVSGDTTGQMLARIADITAYAADIVVVAGGTNDQATVAAGDIVTAGTSIYNTYTMVSRLLAEGSVVVLATYPPNSLMVGATSDAITRRNHFATYNAWVRLFAATTDGVLLYDRARVFADPAAFGPLSSITIDGIHPSPYGGNVLGAELARVLAPLVGVCDRAAYYQYDPLNYVSNPLAAGSNADGSGGWDAVTGITGTGPNGWTTGVRATGAATASKVSRADSRYGDSLARMVMTATASFDGAAFVVGSDDVLGTGRYDLAWVASTAYTYGIRRKPTTPNGYSYKLVVPGTTGGTEPTWPTTEGGTVVDGGVTWLCQRMPTAGDIFQGVAEVTMSGLTAAKWGNAHVRVYALSTTGANMGSVYGLLGDLSGSYRGPVYFPPTPMIIRTPKFTLGSGTIRHLVMAITATGEAGATVTMDVGRVGIFRI